MGLIPAPMILIIIVTLTPAVVFRPVIVTGNAAVSTAVAAVSAARQERIIIALRISQFVIKRRDYVISLVLRTVLINAAALMTVAADTVWARLIVPRINRIVTIAQELAVNWIVPGNAAAFRMVAAEPAAPQAVPA